MGLATELTQQLTLDVQSAGELFSALKTPQGTYEQLASAMRKAGLMAFDEKALSLILHNGELSESLMKDMVELWIFYEEENDGVFRWLSEDAFQIVKEGKTGHTICFPYSPWEPTDCPGAKILIGYLRPNS